MTRRTGYLWLALWLSGVLLAGRPAVADPGAVEDLLGVRARFPLDHVAVAAVVGPGDAGVLVREADGTLHGLDPVSGSVRWTRLGPGGAPAGGTLWQADGAFFVAADALERCDPATGAVAWRFQPGGPMTVLAADEATVLVGAGDLAVALGAHDGRVLWRLREAAGWVAGGLAVGHAVLETAAGGLLFVERGRGVVTGRWGEAGPSGLSSGSAPGSSGRVWRVSEAGARVLVEGTSAPSRKAAASKADTSSGLSILSLDASGREGAREPLPLPAGSGAGLRWTFARVMADGAVARLESADGRQAWLVRRWAGQGEVTSANGLGAPVVVGGPGALQALGGGDVSVGALSALVFPATGGGPWRVVSPGRAAWSVALDGVPATAGLTGELAGGGRWALLLAGEALVRLDLALSRVVGLGALDGDGAAPAASARAVSWQSGPSGGWPLVVRAREVVAGRATRVAAFLGALAQAEARGDLEEARERRERLGRFGLTRALAPGGGAAESADAGVALAASDTDNANDGDEAVAVCAGGACTDPFALDDGEARTVATLREAWLRGDGATVVEAATKWLGRTRIPETAPQRVAAALGWLLLDVAVATDGVVPLELGALALKTVPLRAGLPWLERVVWALVAARAGEDEAAATFLTAREATALGASAARAEALRALRRLREQAGKGTTGAAGSRTGPKPTPAEVGTRLGEGLAVFPHLALVFGPSAARVRALLPRLGTEATALDELDGYAHGLGLHLVGRAAMEVELCVLGCEVLGARCGAEHLEDACVARCTASGAVRLAEKSRAADTGPGWYCGP